MLHSCTCEPKGVMWVKLEKHCVFFLMDVVFCDDIDGNDIDCRLVWSLSSSYQYPFNYIREGRPGGGGMIVHATHLQKLF